MEPIDFGGKSNDPSDFYWSAVRTSPMLGLVLCLVCAVVIGVICGVICAAVFAPIWWVGLAVYCLGRWLGRWWRGAPADPQPAPRGTRQDLILSADEMAEKSARTTRERDDGPVTDRLMPEILAKHEEMLRQMRENRGMA
jgi:hypothetical protein